MLFTGEVRAQDMCEALAPLCSHPLGRRQAWLWLSTNWEQFNQRFA
jgi:hypothetical protein